MRSSQAPIGQTQKLLSRGAIKIRIALASGLALALGGWLMPRAVQPPLSVSEERAAPLLEEQVQIREASRAFVGVQDVAPRVKEQSVAILMPMPPTVESRNDFSEVDGTAPRVAALGVFVSATHVLTHSAALDGRSSIELSLGNDLRTQGRVVAYELSTGLVLLQTEIAGRLAPTFATEVPAAGALAVAVGRSNGLDLAVPVFVTSVGEGRYTIGAINGGILAGMPVFNLAGELLAIAAPDGQEMRAIPVRDAANRLIALASTGERRSSFGLGFQAPTGLLTRTFGAEGVVVTEVLAGGPADRAGLQVGDVILSVGAVVMDSVDTATRALSSAQVGASALLRVRRAGRVRDIEVMPELAYEVAALARASGDASDWPEARVVLPTTLLASAAIPATARVISMNGRPITSRAQAERELRRSRAPVPILLRQGNKRFFVAVEPSR
jgi:S1-C subfamily serine protease